MRLATGVFKSIETRYRLFLSESILGSTYGMRSVPLKISSSVPNPTVLLCSLSPVLLCSATCSPGVIALVLYYRFLHPKSFEIFQSIRHRGVSGACMERGSILSLDEKATPSFHRHATLCGLYRSYYPFIMMMIANNNNNSYLRQPMRVIQFSALPS